MTLTEAQRAALRHLQDAYVGPADGDDEVVVGRPHLVYAVGMLFPNEAVPPSELIEDTDVALGSAVPIGDVDEDGATVPLAEDWRPSSIAITFVTDVPRVVCKVGGGTYSSTEDDGPPSWRRRPFAFDSLDLSPESSVVQLTADGVPFAVGARWRSYGQNHLVTVHVRVATTSTGDDRLDIPLMLFQVSLEVVPAVGGQLLEYAQGSAFDVDDESAELRLRYRNRKVYAVGHGMAGDWIVNDGECQKVFLTPVPASVVPATETVRLSTDSHAHKALSLEFLSAIDTKPTSVLDALDAFVAEYDGWVRQQRSRVASFDGGMSTVADKIVERQETAVRRMERGVARLRLEEEQQLRRAFALGMSAMRLQMARTQKGTTTPAEPMWRPFQLGFLLVALESTLDEQHADRSVVDLVWFPTGGGKTEAYLGLAAIEIFRRRIVHGVEGGGTAVITRYTLRLLTAQQFQRAASLICAMELVRRTDPRARGFAPFSIGLWVGNDVSPGTRRDAKDALDRLHRASRPQEANAFQVERCPWCGENLVPDDRTSDHSRYGMRVDGEDLIIHCTDVTCPFVNELPLSVVDDMLYDRPPTMLLATVDKFARLQFRPEAGVLLGLNTVNCQPSLIIQDELHLLSGPLGTTVAVFDAVIQVLLRRGGVTPKIVASTATIRSSQEQVAGLYGRPVALYPPAGLDDDRNFFSRPVSDGSGRLYLGVMPQSLSQASALIATASPLIEIPDVLARALRLARDAYWTLVMYHNSLRELGRTGTLLLSDVNDRLGARGDRSGSPARSLRSERILELTSRRGPEELPSDLAALGLSIDASPEAVDVVLASNMLSVGIDVPRLALMLMVGQPKTTAEYIQATSRVGRGDTRGVVVTLFRANRARDRSHFETFRGFHDALYRGVEPTSVTPWSMASRDRSLSGALVALVRQSFDELAADTAAGDLELRSGRTEAALTALTNEFLAVVERSDASELDHVTRDLDRHLRDWDRRASRSRADHETLRYDRRRAADDALLKRFGQPGEGWLVADSMRSVEPNVAVQVAEPFEEVTRGADTT